MLLSWSKERRFYNVQLQANLFGGISVFCSWGSIDSKQGSCKIIGGKNSLISLGQLMTT